MHRVLIVSLFALTLAATDAAAQQNRPGFFVASTVPGTGNLGGIAGADKICQQPAKATGARQPAVARLSQHQRRGRRQRARPHRQRPGTTSRARSSRRTWTSCTPTRRTSTTTPRSTSRDAPSTAGRAQPSRHPHRLTLEGRAGDMTCNNWTSAAEGSAMVGHHDRLGFGKPGSPWNAAHPSKGCSAENFRGTGGAGLIYCFAAD